MYLLSFYRTLFAVYLFCLDTSFLGERIIATMTNLTEEIDRAAEEFIKSKCKFVSQPELFKAGASHITSNYIVLEKSEFERVIYLLEQTECHLHYEHKAEHYDTGTGCNIVKVLTKLKSMGAE